MEKDYQTIRNFFFQPEKYELKLSINSQELKPNFIKLRQIYYSVFGKKYVGCNCERGIVKMVKKLDEHFKQFQ